MNPLPNYPEDPRWRPAPYYPAYDPRRQELERIGREIEESDRLAAARAAQKARRVPVTPASGQQRPGPVRRRPPGPLEIAAMKAMAGRGVPMERTARR